MKGDRYLPAEGVNGVRVGPIEIGAGGYVAETAVEAEELDLCEHLVCVPNPINKLSRDDLNQRAAELGIEAPEKLASKPAVIAAIQAVEASA